MPDIASVLKRILNCGDPILLQFRESPSGTKVWEREEDPGNGGGLDNEAIDFWGDMHVGGLSTSFCPPPS